MTIDKHKMRQGERYVQINNRYIIEFSGVPACKTLAALPTIQCMTAVNDILLSTKFFKRVY